MRQLYFTFLLLFLTHIGHSNSTNLAPPLTATISGSTTVCQNAASPQITFSGGGGTAPYTFTYTINGGANLTISTTGINSTVTLPASTSTAGTLTYNLVSVSDNANLDANIGNSILINVITVGVVNPVTLNACLTDQSQTSAEVGLLLSLPSNTSLIQTITINWGDSSPLQVIPASNWSSIMLHTYPLGQFNVTITATTSLGCNTVKTYTAFVGSSPQAATLSLFANQATGCLPHPTQFTFGLPVSNSIGTSYSICFGDATPCISFVSGNTIPSNWIYSGTTAQFNYYTISHVYNSTSCGNSVNLNGITYNNVFLPSVITTNPCTAPQPQAGSLISVGSAPTASFSPNPIPNVCLNVPLQLTNTSNFGSSINPITYTCTSTSPFYWTVSPATPGLWNASGLGSNNGAPNNELFWTTGSATPTITFLQPGNYTVTLFVKNSCGLSTVSDTFCVQSALSPQFTLSNSSGCGPFTVSTTNLTNLINQCSTPTYLWDVTSTSICGSTPNFTYTNGTSASSPNPSFIFADAGTYIVKLTATNTCGSNTTIGQTITVKKPPTVSLNTLSNFCQNINLTASANICSTNAPIITYLWTFPGGSPATATTATAPAVTYSTAGTYTVSLAVTNECGTTTATSNSFVVSVAPVVQPETITICSGVAFTLTPSNSSAGNSIPPGTSYSWSAPVVTGGITGGAAGTNQPSISGTLTNNTTAVQTATYTIIPKVGTCPGSPFTLIVNVNPAPSIATQPASSSVCIGGTPQPLSVTLTSSAITPTYQWFVNTTNATSGGTLIPGAVAATYNPPATVAGTLYYYCVLSFSSGGCSSITSGVATVIVNPIVSISAQPQATQTICAGGSVSALTVSYIGGVGTPSYQWYSNTTNSNTGGIAVGTNSPNYTPPAFTIAGNYFYYVTIALSGNGCGAVTSSTAAIIVVADPAITIQPLATQTQCQNSPATALTVAASGGTGAFNYQWFSVPTNVNTGGTPVGSNLATFTPPTTNVGTFYYYCLISQTGAGCIVNSAVTTVVVVNAPQITTQPQSSTVCLGGSPTTLSVAYNNGVGTPSYQWYTSAGSIPGATNSSFIPLATTVGSTTYYCIITFSSGGCTSITSNNATVIVNPLMTISTQPQTTQTICAGGNATALNSSYAGGVGTPVYQWYSNSTNTTTGGTAVGTNSPTYTPPQLNTPGNYFYYVTITLSGNGCGAVTSSTAEIIVVADPVITTQPLANQTQCESSAATALTVAASGGTGTFSYQWYSVPTNVNTGGTAVGSNSPSFTPPTSNVGTFYYYCLISQSGAGCIVASAVATVVVVNAPQITTQPQSSTVCLGGSPGTLSVAYTNGTGTATYQWYDDIGPISGANSSSYIPSTSFVGTTNYYCIITFSMGGCTSITSASAAVNVNPSAMIDTQPQATQTLCAGGIITALNVSYSGGVGTPTYQWYSNTNNSTIGGVAVGANLSSYTPPLFATPGSYYYYATITLSGNGCGAIASSAAEIIVVADPVVSIQPLANQTQCESSAPTALTVAASGGTGTFSYQWYSVPTNVNTGGTTVGSNSPSFTPPTSNVGTFYYYCLISQSGAGCIVASAVATVVVVNAPQITTQPQSTTICLGGSPGTLSVAYTNGTGTATYQWYDDIGPISGANSSSYIPSTSVVGTTNYYCIITFSLGGCTDITSETAVVTVNPLPAIDLQPQALQSICVGGSIPSLNVTYTGGVGTPSYQWYSNTNNSTTGGIAVGTNSPSYTPPAFLAAGIFFYYVVVDLNGNGCGSATSIAAQVDVLNDPIISSQPTVSQTLCQNAIANILSVSASGGLGTIYNYQWYSSIVNDTTTGTVISGETNNTFLPPTNTAGTVYYYCIITQGIGSGCNVTSAAAEINVNLAPAIVSQPQSSTVCVNQAATILSVSHINGVGAPNYQWFINTNSSNIGGTPIAGANVSTYIAPTAVAGSFYFYCEISFPLLAGGCEIILSDPATVVVNDNPVIANTSTTICSATIFSISPSSGSGDIVPPGTIYTWSIDVNPAGSVSGASAETAGQPNISQTLINSTLAPATVTYIVTPTSGVCQGADFTIVVTVNPAIEPNVTLIDNLCFGVNMASIATNVTGGIPFSTGSPYIYTWTGPNGFLSSATAINNLAPGSYSLTIQDAGGCPFSNTYLITEPADIVITNDSQSDITCFGSNDGSINISVSGGTGSYVYTWTKNNIFYSSEGDLSNLPPGTYTVSVTDANNCGPKTATYTITEPTLLVPSLVGQTNVQCYGASTGAIVVDVVGGTPGPGYIYLWSGPNGFSSNSQNIANIPAGIYTLSVTDANGCVKTLEVTITQSNDIVISHTTTPITCYGANNASLSVTLAGGNAPYQFQWNNLSTSLTQTNLSAGNYIITVTDSFGCVKTQTINIPEAPVFMSDPIVSQITCFGANNGSINLNLTGGIAPVTLIWADGNTSGLIRNNLGPGTYTATISDGTPCFIIQTFTIIEPQSVVLTAAITNAFDCTNANSGAINLIPSGGTPPYVYSWSTGATTEDLNNITSGNYLVTVTDSNGCTNSSQFAIIRQDPIVITVATQTDFDCEAHTVDQSYVASISGGFPPYELQWSSGEVSGPNNEYMHSDVNGTVVLTVTDNLGCVATYSVTVDNPELGYASFEPNSIGHTAYGIYSIGDPIQFNSTITGDFISIYWDFGDGTFSTEENPIHTYVIPRDYIITQVVTYPFGCVYTQIISLIIEQGYMMVVPTAFTPNSDTLNDAFRPVTKRLKNVHLDVYDTWGSIIYSETADVLVGWDGKIKGFDAENGNYYCKVSGETFYGTTVNENHTFVLIR